MGTLREQLERSGAALGDDGAAICDLADQQAAELRSELERQTGVATKAASDIREQLSRYEELLQRHSDACEDLKQAKSEIAQLAGTAEHWRSWLASVAKELGCCHYDERGYYPASITPLLDSAAELRAKRKAAEDESARLRAETGVANREREELRAQLDDARVTLELLRATPPGDREAQALLLVNVFRAADGTREAANLTTDVTPSYRSAALAMRDAAARVFAPPLNFELAAKFEKLQRWSHGLIALARLDTEDAYLRRDDVLALARTLWPQAQAEEASKLRKQNDNLQELLNSQQELLKQTMDRLKAAEDTVQHLQAPPPGDREQQTRALQSLCDEYDWDSLTSRWQDVWRKRRDKLVRLLTPQNLGSLISDEELSGALDRGAKQFMATVGSGDESKQQYQVREIRALLDKAASDPANLEASPPDDTGNEPKSR